MKKIVIAGASGFIGRYLIEYLLDNTNHKIIGLSRTQKISHHDRLEWKRCDLFSVKEIEDVLNGAHASFYLVHSMQPSAHLDQADFIDYDLILADNFGRAAQKMGVQKTIYLSGLMPSKKVLSKHLLSRLEVEEALKEYIPTYVFLRAGLILGKDGSSFNILINLVKRLPIAICPAWINNTTSPVHYSVVVKALGVALESDEHDRKVIDLCSEENLTYLELLKLTAQLLGYRRIFIQCPFNLLFLSRLWVSYISGASKMLVYPLLESLSHNMVARDEYKMKQIPLLSVEESLQQVVHSLGDDKYSFSNRIPQRNTVRSIQRFILPTGMNGNDIAAEYMAWLPKFLYPFVLVDVIDHEWVYFSFVTRKIRLLTLKRSISRSSEDRALFYIKGGILASQHDNGRLEFRAVLNNRYALAAIHEFKPALPWYIYRYTQAFFHLIVMKSFGRHLEKLSRESSNASAK